ncbi:hypothetical protein ZOSMA_139G00270 [Zostera marina]|uniref:FAF domain-containing protein n=1 Tax=Zostera marina TaxID=29655 RepID=A0A0K9PYD9_ZOSMR|nr:hypothetical protein ZOSMA_139G00270 [Zostera marina]
MIRLVDYWFNGSSSSSSIILGPILYIQTRALLSRVLIKIDCIHVFDLVSDMTGFLPQTVDARRNLQSKSGAKDDVRSSKFDVGLWGLHSHYDKSKGRMVGSCTEILGSESSCDDFTANDPDEIQRTAVVAVGVHEERDLKEIGTSVVVRRRKIATSKKVFPPPLPSLTNGWKYTKAVRKDGRLLLTEITIEQPPVVFRPSRVDGHLILQCADAQCRQEEHVVREEETPEAEVEEERRRWLMSTRRCKKVIRNNTNVDHIAARVL